MKKATHLLLLESESYPALSCSPKQTEREKRFPEESHKTLLTFLTNINDVIFHYCITAQCSPALLLWALLNTASIYIYMYIHV